MLAKLTRLLAAALIGVLGVWWGRQVAHSKTPPPQGRWREVSPSDLGRSNGSQTPGR